MARQVKINCICLPVPFTYTGNSIYYQGLPRWTGQCDCSGGGGGGYEKRSAGGERAGEKKP